jgi:predicted DCC family thiol-disulfide oxidoreductase YuxK
MNDHLFFYDADCAFCYRTIVNLLEMDRKKRLMFTSFNGETARAILTGPNTRLAKADGFVLVEDFQTDGRKLWTESQALFRVYWLLGSRRLGWLHYFPNWLCDWANWTDKHRHHLNFGWKRPEFQNDRFLP